MRVKTSVKKPNGGGITLPPVDDFLKSIPRVNNVHWYKRLAPEHRAYVDEIVSKSTRESRRAIALRLKDILQLDVTTDTIRHYMDYISQCQQEKK